MSAKTSLHPRPSFWRKIWKPAASAGAGGASLAIWFEEIIAFCTEMIGVIVMSILAALIFVFDNYVFNANKIYDGDKTTNIKK